VAGCRATLPGDRADVCGPRAARSHPRRGPRYVLYLWQSEPLARLWQPGKKSRDIAGLDGIIELPELGIDLPMAELYRDVVFDS
jgi:hypothetical protein